MKFCFKEYLIFLFWNGMRYQYEILCAFIYRFYCPKKILQPFNTPAHTYLNFYTFYDFEPTPKKTILSLFTYSVCDEKVKICTESLIIKF